MKRLPFIFAFLITILVPSTGLWNSYTQKLQPASIEEVGLSPLRLKRLDKLIMDHIDSGELGGAVILVARHGKTALHEAYGQMSIEEGITMRHDAMFRIASMTKVVTSIAVMMLYEEGNFSLSDPVSKFIPEFEHMKVAIWPNDMPENVPIKTEPAKRQITIRDLLRHTAGFTYGHGFYYLDRMYNKIGINPRSLIPWKGTLKDFVSSISSLPLAYHPGNEWVYSYATDVLGYLIEVISSDSLESFFEKRIFRPLGLKDTAFVVSTNKLERFPNLYSYKNNKLVLVESAASSLFRNKPQAFSGGGGWTRTGYGGIVTTAVDFAKILQLILDGGALDGQRLLSRKTIELMLHDHLADLKGNTLGPGVSFSLISAVLTNPSQYGELGTEGQFWWAGSCNTYFFVDPREEMIGILMTQILPFGHLGLMGKFKRLCMQAISD